MTTARSQESIDFEILVRSSLVSVPEVQNIVVDDLTAHLTLDFIATRYTTQDAQVRDELLGILETWRITYPEADLVFRSLRSSSFEAMVRSFLRNVTEVKNVSVLNMTAQVTLDFGASNRSLEDRLYRIADSWKIYYPESEMALIPFEESYIERFPYETEEHRLRGRAALAPGVVATVEGVEPPLRLSKDP